MDIFINHRYRLSSYQKHFYDTSIARRCAFHTIVLATHVYLYDLSFHFYILLSTSLRFITPHQSTHPTSIIPNASLQFDPTQDRMKCLSGNICTTLTWDSGRIWHGMEHRETIFHTTYTSIPTIQSRAFCIYLSGYTCTIPVSSNMAFGIKESIYTPATTGGQSLSILFPLQFRSHHPILSSTQLPHIIITRVNGSSPFLIIYLNPLLLTTTIDWKRNICA